jgi:hypothetical protein
MSKVQIQGIYAAAVPKGWPADLPKGFGTYGKEGRLVPMLKFGDVK